MKYYLAIDVGGTSIKYGLVNQEGQMVKTSHVKTPETLPLFYQTIENIYHQLDMDVEGIALSMPGAVDSEKGIIGGSSAIDYIHGPNIKEELMNRLSITVEMENDANCAALGEVWQGVAKGHRDCLFIVSGTGIGGAVIKDCHIHKGNQLHGGEFGYMITRYQKDEDRYYTWSDDGSTMAVVKRVAQEMGVNYHCLDGKDIFDHAKENPIYQKYVNEYYRVLASGIYNLQYAYDPSIVVIGGAISQRADLLDQINKQLDKIFHDLSHARIRPNVQVCAFGNDANMIGATYHFIQCHDNSHKSQNNSL